MTPQEIEHHNHKNKLRKEAIDKEVQRLRKLNNSQAIKILNIKKALFAILFLFVLLISILSFNGMINFSGTNLTEEIKAIKLDLDNLQQKNKQLNDSLFFYKGKLEAIISSNLIEREEKGIKFRVQIGAFKEMDLSEYESNLVTINQEKYDSINQYTIGEFKIYSKAKVFLENIKRMGFDDSFIISTKDGRRMPIENLTKKELGIEE